MRIQAYVHPLDVNLFNKGEAIQISPTPRSAHDIILIVPSKKIEVMSNQSGMYITKKSLKSKIVKRFRRLRRR